MSIVEAPETPIDEQPICLPTCGTKHRGCDPQCPKRWYEKGQEEGYETARLRIERWFREEPHP